MNIEAEKIKSMFSEIAPGYDRANNILSIGIHKLWKNRVIELAELKSNYKVLDCATGTGDLAFLMKQQLGSNSKVIGTDFCEAMLNEAKKKAFDSSVDVDFRVEDSKDLKSIESESIDVCTMAFGIRNVQNPELAIREMHRCLKKNGKLLILEFGQPENGPFKKLYRIYSDYILPKVGGFLTGGNRKAYEYLNVSAAKFPCGKSFVEFLNASASFTEIEFEALSGGIAFIYLAKKA